jgi:hypothetical protein
LLRRSTSCHPCYLFECPIGQLCLDISPEEVVDVVETMLVSIGLPEMASEEHVGGNI